MYEEIKPLQEVQLQILKEFKRVADAHDLTWFMAYGTLLGAVRHSGFIPWDDDIDIMMPYQDYVRLEKEFGKDFIEPYFLQSYNTDRQYTGCYMKLRKSDTTLIIDHHSKKDINHGINIDIYPIYNLADGKIQRKVQYINAMFYMLLQIGTAPENHGGFMNIAGKILLKLIASKKMVIKKEYFIRKILRYENEYTKNKFLIIGSVKYMKHVYERDIFKSAIPMRFVDEDFPAPIGYKEFLKHTYGDDYMKLPPEEEQGVKLDHIIKIDTTVPYTKYKGKLYCVNSGVGGG